MRNVICPHCKDTVPVPDDLDQAHCVRCGQALALETNISAGAPTPTRAIQPEAYVERAPSDGPPELPDRYGSWEEFRSLSPAVQRELMRLASRALPDLRGIEARRLPEDAPDRVRAWGFPLGSFNISADAGRPWQIFGYVALFAGVFLLAGSTLLFARKVIAGPRGLPVNDPDAGGFMVMLVFYGLFALALGIYCAFFRSPGGATVLWIFEEGAFLVRGGQRTATAWEDFHDFESVADARRPAYWLTLDHGVSVKVPLHGSPERIPLMEYVEIRLSAAQFLGRLKSIFKGNRELFGVVTLDCQGFQGPEFFAPWAEIRRVVTDSQRLFVDWSQRREWVGVPYEYVSFPYLVIAIAGVLIDEHNRLAPAA
jgi:hypothetical protein